MEQYRELEVTVVSAQDLKNMKLTEGTMNPYCAAWVSSPHMKVPGAVDNGGGTNPTWNSVLNVVVPESLLEQGDANVTIEIYNHGKYSNKFIGSATVPLSDFKAQSEVSSSDSKPMSYPVRRNSGKHGGVVNVVLKVGRVLSDTEADKYAASAMPMGMDTCTVQYEYRGGFNQPMTQRGSMMDIPYIGFLAF